VGGKVEGEDFLQVSSPAARSMLFNAKLISSWISCSAAWYILLCSDIGVGIKEEEDEAAEDELIIVLVRTLFTPADR